MVPPFVFDFYEGVQNSCFVTTHLLRRPDNLRYFAKKAFPVAGKEATVPAKNEKCLDALDVDESFPASKEANIAPMDDSYLETFHRNILQSFPPGENAGIVLKTDGYLNSFRRNILQTFSTARESRFAPKDNKLLNALHRNILNRLSAPKESRNSIKHNSCLDRINILQNVPVHDAKVTQKFDRDQCSDSFRVLQRVPAMMEKIAIRNKKCLGGVKISQKSAKDGHNSMIQSPCRIGTTCIMNQKTEPKPNLDCPANFAVIPQSATCPKMSSTCKNEPKITSSPPECHTALNCTVYGEEYRALKNRVHQLEQEVVHLKKEIADALTASQGADVMNDEHRSQQNTGPTRQSIPNPPPPPPPPPPPAFCSAKNFNISKSSMKKKQISSESGKEKHFMDMKEVLKGLKDVKLKRVNRSPDALKKRKPVDPNDPMTLLEAKLRKRRSAIDPHDDEDDDNME